MTVEEWDQELARKAMVARDQRDQTRRDITIMLVLIMLSLASVIYPDEPDVRIKLSPKVQNFDMAGRSAVRLTIAIQRDDRNRWYEVNFKHDQGSCEEHNFSRQLDGADSPKYQPERVLTRMCPGKYTATVRLHRNDGSIRVFKETATVNGGAAEIQEMP